MSIREQVADRRNPATFAKSWSETLGECEDNIDKLLALVDAAVRDLRSDGHGGTSPYPHPPECRACWVLVDIFKIVGSPQDVA